jgi:acetyltransferase-like isoleucine patch superfamily enzyme
VARSSELHGGGNVVLDDTVILGYSPSRACALALTIGGDGRMRSGTVIYDGSTIGDRFQTGHNVVVREQNRIGDDVSIWSNTVVDYGCAIGHRVKIHSNCYIAQFSELEDDVFIAPGVTLANDLYPGQVASANAMTGPLIRAGAQIGVNVTVLPYVTIGRGAIVGAGSVVTKDIPAGSIAYGAPALPRRAVADLGDVEVRVRRARMARLAGTLGSSSPDRTDAS